METNHNAVVIEREQLTERMVRIALRLDPVDEWMSTGVGDEFIHVEVGAQTPDANDGHDSRHYTVSAASSGTLEMEIFLHGDGPGATWARDVRPGDAVAISDPKSYYSVPEGTGIRVLVGDLTALPAIARILADAAEGERFQVICEVPSLDEARPLPTKARVNIDWRVGGNGEGASVLAGAVRELAQDLPDLLERQPYVWVACESKESRRIRQVLRNDIGMATANYRVVGYWHLDLQHALSVWENATDEQRAQYLAIWREDRTDEENWLELEPFLQKMGA